MNKSDSERIAGYLERLGFSEAPERKLADLVVINTCGVRQSAEDRIYGLIPKLKKENKDTKIVLTGCLSDRKDVQQRMKDKVDIWLSVTNLLDLDKDLKKVFPELRGPERTISGDYLKIDPKTGSVFSAFVPIGNGCDNFCSYCVVPYARGREVYRDSEDILCEIKDLIDKGFKEINLIAQNVNSYTCPRPGSEFDFSDLLDRVASISGDFWVRFSTSHPKDMTQKLIDTVAKHKKICRHIHLPAQAGDNDILDKMNRKYTVEHYKDLIRRIRDKIPGVALTTDIIVGFPGESERQFKNTCDLFSEVGFDMAYVAQFSPRPGTAASDLKDDIDPDTKKDREETLMNILRQTASQNNLFYLNKSFSVLIESRDKKGNFIARTDTNKNVRIDCDSDRDLVGSFQCVEITEAADFGLKGKLKTSVQKK